MPPPPPSPSADLSHLISPSKAAQHQQTTNAWNQITSFLSTLYPAISPSTLKSIERNAATLKSLQALLDANSRADGRRRGLHEERVRQLRVYEECEVKRGPEQKLLQELKASLPEMARTSLSEITEASVKLGYMPDAQVGSDDVTSVLSKRIIELTQRLFQLQSQLSDLTALRRKFEDERQTIELEMAKLREPMASIDDYDDRDSPITDLSASRAEKPSLDALLSQTSNLATSTKHLSLKIREYQDRIAALTQSVYTQTENKNEITIEDIRYKKQVVQQRREEMEKLEDRLRDFHGLPPDVDTSREEVRRVRGELEEWRRRREAMFEDLSGH